jgi:transposase
MNTEQKTEQKTEERSGLLKKSRRSYDESYKRQTVKLVEESTKPLTQIARELEIPENNVRKWVDKYGTKKSRIHTKANAMTLEESLRENIRENARLRKDLAERTEEVEILKKATAYFVKTART